VAVVAGRAFAAEFDGLGASGWWCVGDHGVRRDRCSPVLKFGSIQRASIQRALA
jgi:hypothetical protein